MSGYQSSLMGLGGVKPTGIIRPTSIPAVTTSNPLTTTLLSVSTVLSGACTATVLKTALSVTGKGALTWLGVDSVDTTSRSHRIKITLDGVVIYDGTVTAGIVASRMAIIHGEAISTATKSPVLEGTPLMFNVSLLIEYASSVTETDKATIGYIYYTR